MNILALMLAEQPINLVVPIDPFYVDLFLICGLLVAVYMLFTAGGGKGGRKRR